jgi:proline iminopeptidase
MRDGQLLEKAEIEKIRHIPCTIVQGRYDAVCPAKTAWELHKGMLALSPFSLQLADTLGIAWPEAKFIMVPDAGHSWREPGIAKALVEAMDSYAKLDM